MYRPTGSAQEATPWCLEAGHAETLKEVVVEEFPPQLSRPASHHGRTVRQLTTVKLPGGMIKGACHESHFMQTIFTISRPSRRRISTARRNCNILELV